MWLKVRAPRHSRSMVVVFALIGLAASPATADDAPAAETNDRSKGGSSKKDGDASSSDSRVDSLGTFSDAIPIEVPSFRKIGPSLSLEYRSSNGNGEVGVGWSIDGISGIERASVGKGAPRYDASDIFLLDGQELLPCTGITSPGCANGGTHATKIESYQRIALSGAGSSARWTITAKDGTKSIYAPVFSVPGAAEQVYRWGIQQVVDTKNNVVTYNWANNQFGGENEYVDAINYNGVAIKFYYEQRSDIETAAVGAGKMESITGRIKTIDVTVGGSRLRSYQLTYATSAATSRSLLTTVRQFGRDATLDASGTVTGGTSLPPISAGYSTAAAPSLAGQATDSAMGSGNDRRFIALDINGDGKSDMLEVAKSCFFVCSYSAASWISNGTGYTRVGAVNIPSYDDFGQFLAMDVNGDGKDDFVALTASSSKWKRSIFLSNGTTFTAGATDTTMAFTTVTVNKVKSLTSHVFPADINGDGKTDLIELTPKTDCFFLICNTSAYKRVAWISTGAGFVEASADAAGIPYNKDSNFYALDFNGDGLTDFLEINPGSWGASARRVWQSNGTSFTQVWSDQSGYNENLKVLTMDVNGDGKDDVVEFVPEFLGSRRKTWISTGSSFVLSSNVTSGMQVGSGTRIVSADLNGDGRGDFIAVTPAFLAAQRQVFLSTGDEFVAGAVDTLGSQADHRYVVADVNGDGRSDVVELYTVFTVTNRRVWLSGGTFPDLLTSLGTGFGGTTTVGYTPSSAWTNGNNPPIVQTATSVTTNDGRGGSATTSYSYAGANYDWSGHRFVGFSYQKETKPCIAGEAACPYSETWFRQDVGTAGKPSRLDIRDGSGKLLRSEAYEYLASTTLPWTALPSGKWEFSYVGTGAACPGAECKRKYATKQFNAYGEPITEVDYGDYDVTGDEDTTTTLFVPNTSAYIVNLPADVKILQGVGTAGALINETLAYYDGAASWNAAPTAGLATKAANWLSSPSSFVESKTEYDAWGNVVATVNPLGARSTFTFDPTYHLFPIATKNALGQTTASAFDPVCGQPTQTTDLNGQVATLTYDALCRLVQKSAPGGKWEKHTWVSVGDAAGQFELVETPAADGTSQPRWTRRYFDGLSRDWRLASKGPDAATGDVYVDTTYNARGEQASKTAPYYWTSGTPVIATTTFGYDGLDRPTTTTLPDGAQTTTTYGLWAKTTIDELGRAKTDRFDADGQRVAHVEIVGGVAQTTTYAYDARQALKQSTDPAGNKITYVTDSLGRKTAMTDPNWGAWTYEYDGGGRLTAHVDPKGQRTTFTYDALDRKTSKTTRAGTAQASTATWSYDEGRGDYANLGALTTVTDKAGSKTLDYDAGGRLVNTVRTINGTSYRFQHGFDAGDRPLWTKYPDGDTLGTATSPLRYDGAGRLKSIPGYVNAVSYDASGEATQVSNANGSVTTRTLSSARGWLTAVRTTAGAATVQNLAYTRNAKGQVTRVTSPVANEAWSYAYDELDRLTTATNANAAQNQTLTYDALGNITSNSRRGAYTYGARPHAVLTAGSSAYAYDAAGLMTSGPDRTLVWDGDNRLQAITSAGVTMTFTYDADGVRIQQQEGSITRRYLGDDYELDGSGTATKYVSVAGAVVARKDGATVTWVHSDHIASIQSETVATGAEVHRKAYRPFGEILASGGTLDFEPRGFTGQRHDASGLVYLHARYYDPSLGRFISPDLVIDGTDTIGLNRYAYVGNDPINATDPTGTSAKKTKNSPKASPNNRYKNGNKPVSRVSAQTVRVRINPDGSRTVTTPHSTHTFAPRPPPPPPPPPAYGYASNGNGSNGGGPVYATRTGSSAAVPAPPPGPAPSGEAGGWFGEAAVADTVQAAAGPSSPGGLPWLGPIGPTAVAVAGYARDVAPFLGIGGRVVAHFAGPVAIAAVAYDVIDLTVKSGVVQEDAQMRQNLMNSVDRIDQRNADLGLDMQTRLQIRDQIMNPPSLRGQGPNRGLP